MLLECCDGVTGPTEDHLVSHFHVTAAIAVVWHRSPLQSRGGPVCAGAWAGWELCVVPDAGN